MTTPAPQTAAPAANTQTQPAQTAPAAAPAQARDPYGDKRVSLSQMPVQGFIKNGKYTPAAKPAGTEPPADTDPKAEPAPQTAAPETDPTATTDTTDGQPTGTDDKVDGKGATELKAKNGKVFKDAAELLATYDASAPEAQRLAGENKNLHLTLTDVEHQLTEARESLLKMQEYVLSSTNSPAVPEKYKGMSEEEMLKQMTEPEKMDYWYDKRELTKRMDAFKAKLENAKTETEAIATKTKAEIAKVEARMTQDKDSYPDFVELAPLRSDILKESPHLANRPDTPYISYYIARGIMADKERQEKARLEAESREKAKTQAAGAAASAGAGAPAQAGKSPAPKDDGLRGLVKAAKSLKGHF